MSKHIFVTGGVVSGLGKGIVAASLGSLLKLRGLKVAAQKLDPYVNVDPGTMSPYQHGEVFVTDDGAETDLDLGHYERFIDENLNKFSNLTSGKVYWNVLHKERSGEYLGATVQIIPHVTNEIKNFIYSLADITKADVVITEIGGTIGDIESQPFLEAVRQIRSEIGRENCMFVHVVLVPYLKCSAEHKTKPAQHSVHELQGMGIMPDCIVTRADEPLEDGILDKIAQFCNTEREAVIENQSLGSLYEVPLMLHERGLDSYVVKRLSLNAQEADISKWLEIKERMKNVKGEVEIAICGKYTELHDAYLSIIESLNHAGIYNDVKVKIRWVDTIEIERKGAAAYLKDVDAILVPGGFGERGIEGMITAANYARINDIPYLGICLGMQIAVIEAARNMAKMEDANSREFNPKSKHLVIDLMENQKGVSDKGGTMRLGAYECMIKDGTLLKKIYNEKKISERHRHRYEVSNEYRSALEESGIVFSGLSPNGELVEAMENPKNKFFVAVQFHPEFKSRPNRCHPLFYHFVKSAISK